MNNHKYSDLHCHPGMRPILLSKKSIWDTHLGKRIKRIIKLQKKGKRGGLYDQSGYPKLINANVKLVYVSLYPVEQGFMMNNNFILELLNIASKPLRFFFARNNHFRDFFLSMFSKFPVKKIKKLKKQEYWDGFIEELELYKNYNGKTGYLTENSRNEIEQILKYAYKSQSDSELKVSGQFIVADKDWKKTLPSGDKILTVLTMEGMAIVSQTKRSAIKSKHGTRLLDEKTIMDRFEYIKLNTPIFFVTFSHHFSSGLCGHAKSFPDIANDLGILDQNYFRNNNFSRIGYNSLKYLLSIKIKDGKPLKDESLGRRILIDVKHMSLKGRLSLYQIVKNYNLHNDDKIPIIASHVGFSNRTIADMLFMMDREKTKTQPEETKISGRDHIFNTWSINLGVEEIDLIVRSGGLIGVSLEQNNLGIPFGTKTKNKPASFFARLVMNQILAMAKASKNHEFWNHITIGTDFDGIIDPVDRYTSVLFFSKLRSDLKKDFSIISETEREEASMPNSSIDEILDNFFFNNSYRFLQKHFDSDLMPSFK